MAVDPAGATTAGTGSAGTGRSGIELRGVDRIPEAERTSSPSTFFVIFVGTSVGLGAVAFGWLGITFGLGVWDTISAIAVGTLIGQVLLVPLIIIGSRTATNNATSSGATFGVRGRIIGSVIGLLTCLLSIALTVWASAAASTTAAGVLLGLPDSPVVGALAYAVVAALAVAVAIWGYRWLVRSTTLLMIIGGVLLLLMPVAFGGAIDWSYAGGEYLFGSYWTTWVSVAATVGTAGALIVCTIVGDWTRYIRADRYPPRALVPIASAGLFIGFVVPAAIGAAVSTAFVDPTIYFPINLALEAPTWYAVLLLPLALLGGVGLTASSLYSAGLDLDALVVRLGRPRATVAVAVVAVVLIYIGLAAPTASDAFSAGLLFLAELSAPWAVIVGIGFLRTGGRYDADDLQVFNRRETGGRYWYSGGWNWAAALAWVAGSVVGLLTIQTALWSGPLAYIAGGFDISLLAGSVVAAVLFLVLPGRQPAG